MGYVSCPRRTKNLSLLQMVILLIAVYLLLVLVLPLTLSAAVSYRSLPSGRACPHCAGETIRLKAWWLHVPSNVTPSALQQRFCFSCGWEGVARIPKHMLAPAVARSERTESAVNLKSASANSPSRTVDVRWLTVDGVPWRVQLECWKQTGLCYGRLVFVEPSGRHWLDLQPFAGRTDRDVLGQALSLPDRFLASRLRELVSD
jgi:hypothetical protein